MTSVFLCVALVALAGGCASAAADTWRAAGPHSRRLLSAAAGAASDGALSTQQCSWDQASNSCEAADAMNIMYAVRGPPNSPYLSFLLMNQDRKTACDSYDTRDACRADAAHNCVWLDDVLVESGSKTRDRPARVAAAEMIARGGAAAEVAANGAAADAGVPNLFTSQFAELQQQLGASLQEALARTEPPIMQPALEVMAAAAQKPPAAAAGSPGLGQAPAAPKPSSTGSSSSSSSSSSSRRRKRAVRCTSREQIENVVFQRSGYSSVLQAPLAMHCPGSKAYNLAKCMSQTSNAACQATPGCVVVPRISSRGAADLCVSDYFNKLSKAQMNTFMYDLTLAEPSVVGSCAGACWLRQALLCNHTKGADDCSSLSFCRSLGASCVPKLYDDDNFGSTVQEYLGECLEVDNRQDCERLSINLVNKGRYAQWSMPAAAAAKCTVPSVGGMLGRQVTKQNAARVEMLTLMGKETEKQAAALAAATAAKDAAEAGRIMLERGAPGLQQLYSSVSTVVG